MTRAKVNHELQPGNVLTGKVVAVVVIILNAAAHHIVRAKVTSGRSRKTLAAGDFSHIDIGNPSITETKCASIRQAIKCCSGDAVVVELTGGSIFIHAVDSSADKITAQQESAGTEAVSMTIVGTAIEDLPSSDTVNDRVASESVFTNGERTGEDKTLVAWERNLHVESEEVFLDVALVSFEMIFLVLLFVMIVIVVVLLFVVIFFITMSVTMTMSVVMTASTAKTESEKGTTITTTTGNKSNLTTLGDELGFVQHAGIDKILVNKVPCVEVSLILAAEGCQKLTCCQHEGIVENDFKFCLFKFGFPFFICLMAKASNQSVYGFVEMQADIQVDSLKNGIVEGIMLRSGKLSGATAGFESSYSTNHEEISTDKAGSCIIQDQGVGTGMIVTGVIAVIMTGMVYRAGLSGWLDMLVT